MKFVCHHADDAAILRMPWNNLALLWRDIVGPKAARISINFSPRSAERASSGIVALWFDKGLNGIGSGGGQSSIRLHVMDRCAAARPS
jgi:hypothetical protein